MILADETDLLMLDDETDSQSWVTKQKSGRRNWIFLVDETDLEWVTKTKLLFEWIRSGVGEIFLKSYPFLTQSHNFQTSHLPIGMVSHYFKQKSFYL
ncbi:hypothetical protein HanIR_Chr17g0875131 [Helianthus annuus]|nr:hypothetical protein HanIR_Chr17g0875131 [Helianthus annuus]